jgi:hypothetical protein
MQGGSMERKFVRAAHCRGNVVTCGERLAAQFQAGGAIGSEDNYVHTFSYMRFIFGLNEQAYDDYFIYAPTRSSIVYSFSWMSRKRKARQNYIPFHPINRKINPLQPGEGWRGSSGCVCPTRI